MASRWLWESKIVSSNLSILNELFYLFLTIKTKKLNFYSLMYLLILLFPFLSFLSTTLLGRFIGVFGSKILATFSIILSFMLSLVAFYESALSGSVCSVIISS